jgi:hypothetical protein
MAMCSAANDELPAAKQNASTAKSFFMASPLRVVRLSTIERL